MEKGHKGCTSAGTDACIGGTVGVRIGHVIDVTDDCNRACTHSAKAKPEGSDKVRNCRCRSREHDAETSHA